MKTKEETQKLPKAFKTKWLKALRSGKFKKGKSMLYDKDDDTYCCLGVAGAICGVTNMHNICYLDRKENKKIRGLSKVPKLLIGNGTYSFSLDAVNPIAKKLSYMNDKGSSFNKIADWIEKHL